MAKISQLPILPDPTGEEAVVVLGAEGATARIPAGALARAAVSPAIDGVVGGLSGYAVTSALSRRDLFAMNRVDDAYEVPAYASVQFTAPAGTLGEQLDGVEVWISTNPAARTLRFDLYSRAPAAPNDGAPVDGDRLLLTERRALADMPFGAGSGATRRYVVDFLRTVPIDPARSYVLQISALDPLGEPAGIGFSRAYGPDEGDAGYPVLNGLYTNLVTPTIWREFMAGSAPAIRWQAVARARAGETAGRIAALAIDDSRTVTLGAPIAALIGAGDLAAGTWLNPTPAVQGGTLESLWCVAAADGPAEVVFAERMDGDAFVIRHVVPLMLEAGENDLAAGGQFDAVAIERGWHIGIRQIGPLIRYGTVGTSLLLGDDAWTVYPNVMIAVAARLRVTSLVERRGAARQRRTSLWHESLLGRTPIGWDIDPNIVYGGAGLRLAVPASPASWGLRVHTRRHVRTDRRVTRAVFDWTDAGSVIGLDTIGAINDIIDAKSANSLVLVDGAANTLKIMRAANGETDPGISASVPLGFPMTVGHRYVIEWGLDGAVHSAQLIDATTSSRSPKVTAGDPAFAGVDTAEGRQVSSLSLAYHTGNATFIDVEVLHDGPPPAVVVLGDSLAQGVFNTRAQRWAGLLQAEGVEVLLAAQAGGITESGRRCAEWEVLPTRPDFVIAALGANDAILNIPPATYRVQLLDIIAQARRVGARIVLPVLHPCDQYDAEPYRAVVRALAAAPDVDLWRWDLALTVGGDGVTPDMTRLVADKLHLTPAGNQALLDRLRVDVPAIWD